MYEGINITDAELEVIKIIWNNQGTTAKFICDELQDKMQWSSSTVKTLLSRLCNKQAIAFDKKGKEYYYFTLISKEKYTTSESKSFLDKMFNGSINLMVLNFVKNKKLSQVEAEELRKILSKVEVEEE